MIVGMVHRTDPETSYEAAQAMVDSGKRATHKALVLLYVRRHPGLTAGELGEMTGLGRFEAARRLTDLRSDGVACFGPKRRCTQQGTMQMTWQPVTMQGELL